MKKFKLLPTILMLVLSVGVLAVGVFAITPTKNSISGTITIGAAAREVSIQMNIKNIQGNDVTEEARTIRGGDTFTLGDIVFDSAAANNLSEVEDVIIEFNITNPAIAETTLAAKQANTVGAFFAKNTVSIGDNIKAKGSDIFTYDSIKNAGETITYINIYADSYTPIMPGETVSLEIRLSMESFEALDKSPLNYLLYIESYEAGTNEGLVKLPITESLESTVAQSSIAAGTTHVAIPATYKTIADGAYNNGVFYNARTTVKGVNLPSTLTEIGSYAFEACSNLTKIKLPENLITIDNSAFSGCTGLTKIVLPEGLVTIGSGAFDNCIGLSTITIPSTVRSLDFDSFSGATRFTQEGGSATKSQLEFIGLKTIIVKAGATIESITQPEFGYVSSITAVPEYDADEEGVYPGSVWNIGWSLEELDPFEVLEDTIYTPVVGAYAS